MIRIRHSTEPCKELELEGSNLELAELREAILCFCNSDEATMDLAADSQFDPAPYQYKLTQLHLQKTTEPITISATADTLSISGKPVLLRLFSQNLPYNAHHTSSIPYHVHFERIGREDHVSEASLSIVLALKK